jgi:hypothetical protein
VLVALALEQFGASQRRISIAVGLFALSPLALGPISLNTYDAWPALLTVLALWLLLRGSELPAFAVLGLAVSAKVYPLVLVPVAAWLAWRRSGPRRLALALGLLVLVAAAVIAPFAAYAPHGVYESFHAQATRGLQIESLGAALLLVLDKLGLYDAHVTETFGVAGRNLSGGRRTRSRPCWWGSRRSRSRRSGRSTRCARTFAPGSRSPSRRPSPGSSRSRRSSRRSTSSGCCRSWS